MPWISLVVLLSIVSRLPQLLSPYLHLDGDECVLGLMAQHMAAGKDFPFYYWGQGYGFSWLTSGAIAIALKTFGVSVLSVKIPMFLLWTLGCVFFYCALAQWTAAVYAFWITCLLVFSSSWMVWSTMAYIYTSGFIFSCLLFLLLSKLNSFKGKQIYIWIGVVLGALFFSQPLFLIIIVALIAYTFKKHAGLKDVFMGVLGFTGVFILAKIMALIQGNTDFWKPVVFKPDNVFHSFSILWQRVYGGVSQISDNIDWAAGWATKLWCLVFVVCLVGYCVDLLKGRVNKLSTVFLVSIIFVLGVTFILNKDIYGDRYFLPLSLVLIMWVGIQGFDWLKRYSFLKPILGLVIGVFIVLGFFTSLNARLFYRSDPKSSTEVPEMQKISKVIEFLDSYGIKHVFSIDDDLSWKVLFFSRERIIVRWMNMKARQPLYPLMVDQAYLNGERTALAGNAIDEKAALMIVAPEGRTVILADQYFVQLAPTQEMVVDKMGFQFN
ncbi:MAG: hypothetical protein HQL15_02395 [Candidatus Omnitrophica bacterium]|nr:hypothetical protein [Candidatus Omnitrophota bacterium]